MESLAVDMILILLTSLVLACCALSVIIEFCTARCRKREAGVVKGRAEPCTAEEKRGERQAVVEREIGRRATRAEELSSA